MAESTDINKSVEEYNKISKYWPASRNWKNVVP